MAVIGAAGLMSAKGIGVNSGDNKTQDLPDGITTLRIAYDWVPVHTSCGKVFYLDANDYVDCYECLQEDARQFTDAQCGAGAGFELPY